MTAPYTVADRRKLVQTRGHSYASLAGRCACSRGKVRKVIDGERIAAIEQRIADALGVSADSFFGPFPTLNLPTVTDTRWQKDSV